MTGTGFPWDMVFLALMIGILLGMRNGKKQKKRIAEQDETDSPNM
ncbi:MAG: hypothetical protein AAF824_12175 [Bacteroidota bacterium]